MNANFDQIYDTAQECSAQLVAAVKQSGVKVLLENHIGTLEISDRINYRVLIMPCDPWARDITMRATDEDRDCTVHEILQVTATAISKLQELTREGRIKSLREELAKLEAEEAER